MNSPVNENIRIKYNVQNIKKNAYNYNNGEIYSIKINMDIVCHALFCCGYTTVYLFIYSFIYSFIWFLWFMKPCPSGLLHWHWGNHKIASVPVE